ncbi:MAG: 16S rRNA (cytidine(1402)-2'-O)-methyltransferase [Acidobacteria bacterium]|nr:16S rRNA (cytidine(1402)-2'-O)-methyltransferase [Acidobacteriota bacterium]
MTGTLYVVGTPIGNLEDLTFRALRILEEVDLIAAEDTRRTAKLLAHYEVRKPMVSLREHNERRETPRLVAQLTRGKSVALVSDAGTPGISDPGAHLVAAAHRHGIAVRPIPGASAVTASLSAAGFPASQFVVIGFPSRESVKRQSLALDLAEEERTAVIFEAPHRVSETLRSLSELKPARTVAVFREMTKLNEACTLTTTDRLAEIEIRPQGEFVIVLGPRPAESSDADRTAEIVDFVGRLTAGRPFDLDEAVRIAALTLDERPSRVANVVRRRTILAKRQNSPSS